MSGVKDRPKRDRVRQKDPDFVYGTPLVNLAKNNKKQKKEQRRLKQQKLRDNPEHIFYDYLYEDIENEILACDNEPCDIQFFTNRTDEWIQVCMSYYQKEFEKEKFGKPVLIDGKDGKRFIVPRAKQEGNYITMYFYNSGIVLIQG